MNYSEFEHMRALRWVKKIKAINSLGGACVKCGERNFLVLEFHHLDPKAKKYSVARIYSHTISRVLNEVKKCQLLCCNCHADHHYKNPKIYKVNMLKYKGVDVCGICGHSGHSSLDFHHVDPKDKVFGLGNKSYSERSSAEIKESVERELDKCDVLCKNCHRIEHYGEEVDGLSVLINEKIYSHTPNASPLSKKRECELERKHSCYRSHLAKMILEWKKHGKNIRIAADNLGMDSNTLSDNLSQSNIYLKYRERVSKKTSKYKGVSWSSDRGKWIASIKIDGKGKNLGRYDSEEEAKEAYRAYEAYRVY